MFDWFLIAAGGGLGALARHALGSVMGRAGAGVPWGTLTANALGAVGLGLLLTLLDGAPEGERTRLFLGVGFLGAFTTFSTFAVEIVRLGEGGEWQRGAAYAAGSIALGVTGVLLGAWAGATIR